MSQLKRPWSRRRLVSSAALLFGSALGASLLAACQQPTPPAPGPSQQSGGTPVKQAPGAASSTFKIGVLAPISGTLSDYGDQLKKSAELGVTIINEKGGIGGRQVSYVLEDEKTDPSAAAERAKKLLTQDNVDVLMGTISSACTLAVIPEVEQAKRPYFYAIEGEDKSCTKDGGTRRYIFGNSDTVIAKMLLYVPWMVKNLGKSYYFIGSDYVFPHSLNEFTIKLLKEQGATVLAETYAPLGTSDFSSHISKIEAAKPEVLFISVVGTDGVAMVKQAAQFGLKNKMKITGTPAFDPTVFSGIADVADGAYTVYAYWDGLDNPINQEFVPRYRKQFDPPLGIVSTVAAMSGYGTMLIIRAAVEKAGSTQADAIIKALEGLKVQTPAGEVEMGANNHLTKQPIRLLQVAGKNYRLVQELGIGENPDHLGCSSGDI